MKIENKTMLIYIALGIPAGIISTYLKNNIAAVILAIIILYAAMEVMKKLLKISEKKDWFMKNGGWMFIFVWFLTWIIFYNIWGI